MGYCTWAEMNEANQIYHDTEWGIPVHDDRHMFEHLTLECLQCGLSWDLMLKSGIINDHGRDCPCFQRINDRYPTINRRRDHEMK